ncbi:MAG: hypothetical protein LBD64_02820, partial [Odoribacteraceae bacterium]|nr:hypothetical protein [Odoribacteraceae bacterium]
LFDFQNTPFPNPGYIAANTTFFQLQTRAYLFFATGNNLYWYDHLAKTARLFYTFPAGTEVIKMAANPQESELGAVLSNGKFIILNIENDRLMTTDNKVYELDIPGKIVDMEYKYPNASTYNSLSRTSASNWD